MNCRTAPGRRLKWIDTRINSGFSNFLFIDKNYRSHSVLRRIFSLARAFGYQSLLIEELSEDTCNLIAEENAALRIRRPDYRRSVVHRLTFWRCLAENGPNPTDLIGYAIFKSDQFDALPYPQDHIYESVLPSFRMEDQNNFIHCRRTYTVQTCAGTQAVTGVLYAQQNDLTFVCAHVALRTALACLLPDADIGYARMNELAGVDHRNKTVGEGLGLSPDDLEAILNGLNIAYGKIVHEPSEGHDLPTEFQRDLYGFIESGGPALVGFELDSNADSARHIVPVIGHTFNNDTWVPDAQRSYFGNKLGYFSSESWLSSYVLHDDNFGPYYCLPRHFLKKDNFRIILGLQRHSTSYSANEAETLAFGIFKSICERIPKVGLDWYDRFQIFCDQGLLVLRTQLIERDDYIDHLKTLRSWENTPLETEIIAELYSKLPERFWMVEASAQELFNSSRRKFGEMLLSSNIPVGQPLNTRLLLSVRLPGLLLLPNVGVRHSQLQSHTAIYASMACV